MSLPTTALARLANPQHSPIHALAFSSGTGQYLLTGSQDRAIRLWNPLSRRLVQTFAGGHAYEVLDLAVDGRNERVVSGAGDKTVLVWDVASARTSRRFSGHAARVHAVAFAGEADSVVVSGSLDGTVKMWDLRAAGAERPMASWSEAKDSITSVEVRGCEVYAGSVDGSVRVYDMAMGVLEEDVVAPGKGVTSVMPTQAGDAYLASSLDSTMRLMDRATGKCLQTFRHDSFQNEAYRIRSTLAVAEAYAVSGTEDGRVLAWDVLSGEMVHQVWHKHGGHHPGAGHTSKMDVVSAVAWNQPRKMWASAGGDGTVVIWGTPE